MLITSLRWAPAAAAPRLGVARAAASDGGMGSGHQNRPPFTPRRTRRAAASVVTEAPRVSRLDLYV